MNRRQFLIGCTASGMMIDIASSKPPQYKEKTIRLWPGIPPGGGGPVGGMKLSMSGAVSNIDIPTLTIITPSNPNGHGVLIAGGGGYRTISNKLESRPAAEWLVVRGYTAYILTYRLPAEKWKDGVIVSLQDAQRALRIMRQYEKKVSVLGFSAGGHLLGMLSVRPEFETYKAIDDIDTIPIFVEKAALIYPVITLEQPYTRTSTHTIFAGKNANDAQNAVWSIQNYVTPKAPPFFLVNAENDKVVPPQNTLIMADICRKENVPVTIYRYEKGGHGFALGKPNTPASEWPQHYQDWLQDNHL